MICSANMLSKAAILAQWHTIQAYLTAAELQGSAPKSVEDGPARLEHFRRDAAGAEVRAILLQAHYSGPASTVPSDTGQLCI